MNEGEVKREPEKTTQDGKPTQPDAKKEGGVDITAAAGTVAQVFGNIALFTGLTGAAIVILTLMIDPLGLWSIPILLGGGYLVNRLGHYLDHKASGTEKEFSFFPNTGKLAPVAA